MNDQKTPWGHKASVPVVRELRKTKKDGSDSRDLVMLNFGILHEIDDAQGKDQDTDNLE